MPKIQAGTSITLAIPVGSTLFVGGGAGTIQAVPPAPVGAPVGSTPIGASDQRYGPYERQASVNIVAQTAVNYGFDGPSKGASVDGSTYTIFGDSLSASNNAVSGITSISASGGVVTVVTSSAHNVRDNQRVTVALTGNATLHVRNWPVAYISATSFSYVKADAAGSAATGSVYAQNNFGMQADVAIGNALLGGRMRFLGNFGVPSENTTNILARISEVIALTPNIVFFQGGTNDPPAGLLFAQTVSNIEAIVYQLTMAGALVVIKTIPPYGAIGGVYSAANVTQFLEVNKFIRKLPSRYQSVVVVDAYRALINPTDANGLGTTGFYRPGDQIHYNARAAMAIGRLHFAALQNVVPAIDLRPTSTTDNFGFNSANRNLFDNAPWNTTGGTVNAPATGALPTNWIIDAPSGTFTAQPACSVASRSDGLGFEVTVAAQAGAAGANFTLRASGTALNARLPSFVGAKYRLVLEVEVTNGLTGNLRGLNVISIVNTSASTGNIATCLTGNSDTGVMQFDSDTATRLTLTSPEFLVPSGTPSAANAFYIVATFDAASAVSCTLKVSNVQWQPMDEI